MELPSSLSAQVLIDRKRRDIGRALSLASPAPQVLLDSRPDEEARATFRLSETASVGVQADPSFSSVAEGGGVSCAGVGTLEATTATAATQTDASNGNGASPLAVARRLQRLLPQSEAGDGEENGGGGKGGEGGGGGDAAEAGGGAEEGDERATTTSSAAVAAAASAAVAAHRRALERDPQLVEAVSLVARAAEQALRENQAMDPFEDAVSVPPSSSVLRPLSSAASPRAPLFPSRKANDSVGFSFDDERQRRRRRMIRSGGVDENDDDDDEGAPPLRRASSLRSSSSSSAPVSALDWSPIEGGSASSFRLAVARAPWELCYGGSEWKRRYRGEEEPLLALWEPTSSSSSSQPLASFLTPAPPTAVALPPRGDPNLVLAGLSDGRLALFDARTKISSSSSDSSTAAAAAVSPAALSHGGGCSNSPSSSSATVRALAWPPSRNPSDIASGGSDGRVLWWDARELAKGPVDSLQVAVASGGGASAKVANSKTGATTNAVAGRILPPPPPPPAVSALASAGTGTTRLLAATDHGFLLPVSRSARGGQQSNDSSRLGVALGVGSGSNGNNATASVGGHFGPISSLHPHPFLPRIHLTAGAFDGCARVWSEEARTSPLLCPPRPPRAAVAAASFLPSSLSSSSSPSSLPCSTDAEPRAAVAARWSPTRPSIYYLLMSDGSLTAHDIRERVGSAPRSSLLVGGGVGGEGKGSSDRSDGGTMSNSSSTSTSIMSSRATALAEHGSGSLLAVGLGCGSVELVRVGSALSEAERNERGTVATILEREIARERSLERSARDARARQRRRDEEAAASRSAAARREAASAAAVSRYEAAFLEAVR